MPALRLKIADLSSIFYFFLPFLILFSLLFFPQTPFSPFRGVHLFSFPPSLHPGSFSPPPTHVPCPRWRRSYSNGCGDTLVFFLFLTTITVLGRRSYTGITSILRKVDQLFSVVVGGRSGCGGIQLPVPARFM